MDDSKIEWRESYGCYYATVEGIFDVRVEPERSAYKVTVCDRVLNARIADQREAKQRAIAFLRQKCKAVLS